MNHAVSFIPAPRLIARRKRSRKSLWFAINAATLTLGGTAILASQSRVLRTESSSSLAIETAQSKLDSIVDEQHAVAADLKKTESRLAAHAEATQHPDWSILLAYISRLGANNVALTEFAIERADLPGAYTVNIAGSARSQNDVTRFLLGLERSGVFSDTALIRSAGVTTGAYAFAIACEIGDHSPPSDADPTEGEG